MANEDGPDNPWYESVRATAREHHRNCPGGTRCDCQHVVGMVPEPGKEKLVSTLDEYIEQNNISEEFLLGYAAGLRDFNSDLGDFLTCYQDAYVRLVEKIKERVA